MARGDREGELPAAIPHPEKILYKSPRLPHGKDADVKPISQLRFDHDTTTIRRCHDAFDYDGSDRNYDLLSIRLRYDYDMTTTKN